MKIILSSRRYHYIAVVSIFLITVVLITGMMSCSDQPRGDGDESYTLTIASTAGGSVTTPSEGTSKYDETTVVDLVATPDVDWWFDRWMGDVSTIADIYDSTTTITVDAYSYDITAIFKSKPMLAAGPYNTVGLRADGTVVAAGCAEHDNGQCDVSNWADIVHIATGDEHTVGVLDYSGLPSLGTNILVAGNGNCLPDNIGCIEVVCVIWEKTIIQVAAGACHTVGLAIDGTVLPAGVCDEDICFVGGWENIIQVAAGAFHTVGLKDNGTVVAVGNNDYGQCDVSNWGSRFGQSPIVQVAVGSGHTVGLRADGTVVATGNNNEGQCDVGGWSNIVQIAVGEVHTVGLTKLGNVVAVGDCDYGQCGVGSWSNIVQIAAGAFHTVGLRADGTVVAAGCECEYTPCDWGQCDVQGWMLG